MLAGPEYVIRSGTWSCTINASVLQRFFCRKRYWLNFAVYGKDTSWTAVQKRDLTGKDEASLLGINLWIQIHVKEPGFHFRRVFPRQLTRLQYFFVPGLRESKIDEKE